MSLPDPVPEPGVPEPNRPLVPYPPVPPMERGDLPPVGLGAPATWGIRAISRLTDYLLINLVSGVLLTLVLGRPRDGEELEITTALALGILALQLLYEVLFVAWRGQTPGKLLGGIVIVRYQDGRKPTLTQAVARALVPFAALVLGGILGGFLGFQPLGAFAVVLVYLTSMAHPVGRGLHDRAGGTIVLTTRRPGAGRTAPGAAPAPDGESDPRGPVT